MKIYRLIVICLLLAIHITAQQINAQEEQPQNLVLVCVTPEGKDPYPVVFRNTNLVGLIIPNKSIISVYSETVLAVSIFSIIPDTVTGGYKPQQAIAVAIAGSNIPVEPSCANYLGEIGTNFLSTIPIPISKDHIVMIQIGTNDYFVAPNLLGVFSFNFSQDVADFQVVQLRSGKIEMKFPFFPEDGGESQDTTYTLIANKPVNTDESFPTGWGNADKTDSREIFYDILTQRGLNLFEIMADSDVRIYPTDGLISTYTPGKFLRLDMLDAAPSRTFSPGDKIVSLTGSETINYYAVGDPSKESSVTSNQLRVIRIDELGRLIVQVEGGPELVVKESWLVERIES